jgi:hypothetical protein
MRDRDQLIARARGALARKAREDGQHQRKTGNV